MDDTRAMVAQAREAADAGDLEKAAMLLGKLARINHNGPGLPLDVSMRFHETHGAIERAANGSYRWRHAFGLAVAEPEIERARAVFPGILTIGDVHGSLRIALREAAESYEPDGSDAVIEDLTADRPWRIRLKRAQR